MNMRVQCPETHIIPGVRVPRHSDRLNFFSHKKGILNINTGPSLLQILAMLLTLAILKFLFHLHIQCKKHI